MGYDLDIIVIADEGCGGFQDNECGDYMDGISELISSIKDDSNRVGYVSMGHIVQKIISLGSQPSDKQQMIQSIKNRNCNNGQAADTDLFWALIEAIDDFEINPSDRFLKIVIVSSCMAEGGENVICSEFNTVSSGDIRLRDGKSVQVTVVNVQSLNGDISEGNGESYLSCFDYNNSPLFVQSASSQDFDEINAAFQDKVCSRPTLPTTTKLHSLSLLRSSLSL
jgi:hypothetical protein